MPPPRIPDGDGRRRPAEPLRPRPARRVALTLLAARARRRRHKDTDRR